MNQANNLAQSKVEWNEVINILPIHTYSTFDFQVVTETGNVNYVMIPAEPLAKEADYVG